MIAALAVPVGAGLIMAVLGFLAAACVRRLRLGRSAIAASVAVTLAGLVVVTTPAWAPYLT